MRPRLHVPTASRLGLNYDENNMRGKLRAAWFPETKGRNVATTGFSSCCNPNQVLNWLNSQWACTLPAENPFPSTVTSACIYARSNP